MKRLPLFVLSDDLLANMHIEDMKATLKLLHEHNAITLPVPFMSIEGNYAAFLKYDRQLLSPAEQALREAMARKEGFHSIVIRVDNMCDLSMETRSELITVTHWKGKQCLQSTSVTIEDVVLYVNEINSLGDVAGASAFDTYMANRGIDLVRDSESQRPAIHHALACDTAYALKQIVVCALATKNTVRESKNNAHAALGIVRSRERKSGVIHVSRCILSPPMCTTASGRVMPMHFRRAHPHTFWAGPNRDQKRIHVIPGLWVNKDESLQIPAVKDYSLH